MLLAAAAYTFTLATHLTFRFEHLRAMDHYRAQANGLANGSLELYDNEGRPTGPFLDTCNYKGRAYIVYGLLPAGFQLVLNNFAHLNVTSGAIMWLIGMLTLYALYWAAFDVGRWLLGWDERDAALAAGLVCLAAAATRQFVHQMIVPYAWGQAAATAQLFCLLATWLTFRHRYQPRAIYVMAAGFFVGCAAFSKANGLLIVAPVFLWLLPGRPKLRTAFLFGVPLAAMIACMMAANVARFGDPMDIGFRYANTSENNPADWDLPRLHRIPYNFYNHFLAPPALRTGDFPLVDGLSQRFGQINQKDGSGGLLHNVPLYSAFLATPLLWLIPLHAVLIAVRRLRGRKPGEEDAWWAFFTLTGACSFGLYLMHDSSWLRYQYDYLFFIALAVLITVAGIARDVGRWRPAWRIVVAAAVLCHTALGFEHAMTLLFSRTQPFMYWDFAAWRPSDDRIGARVHFLRRALIAPDAPERVYYETDSLDPAPPRWAPGAVWRVRGAEVTFESDGFEWIHIGGKWPGDAATVKFPANPRPSIEPLYTIGPDLRNAEWIAVRYGARPPGRIFITLLGKHWQWGKPCESAPIDVEPGRAYRMTFLIDAKLRQLAVTLDGKEMLYCRPTVFGDDRAAVNFGRFASGEGAVFSGEIEAAAR
jgi:hypothetical protein